MWRTTRGGIRVALNGGALAAGYKKSPPVVFVGVAQVLVLRDDHIPVADFLQRAKAQGGDAQLSHSQTADATTKKKKIGEKKR